jgi:hypothetical protein
MDPPITFHTVDDARAASRSLYALMERQYDQAMRYGFTRWIVATWPEDVMYTGGSCVARIANALETRFPDISVVCTPFGLKAMFISTSNKSRRHAAQERRSASTTHPANTFFRTSF